MKTTEKLYLLNRNEWRSWLKENHDTQKYVWILHYKKHTGKNSIPYDDAVEEALCFGWIDSIIKKIDDEKFIRKFTPRKRRSRWSESNKKRAEKMIKEGKMTEAGITKIMEAKKDGEWFKTTPKRKELVIPSYVKDEIARNKTALEFFNSLARPYKRNMVMWITSAKKEETRKKRLTEVITLLKQKKKLGLK